MKVAYISNALALTVALVSAATSDYPDHVAKLMNLDVDPCEDFYHKDDKLFFVSYAQNWCTKYRDAAVKNLIATDPHTPSMWRVNGVVMNSKEFAKTFQCAANKPMNPTKKCIVW
ncbi:TPA: hypothetical protein N0F65_010841 [Lagenidium giganteum]|uniref:Peptidase M13 C-terminal domain-containing protein n=1 Tax=Lagenidium giganteum TaxID=4803 RepID=A0AAV2Z6R6_9STRA|nr:TPA: hypothetical protein N0F65_010841 [Lagenidium giganteum]